MTAHPVDPDVLFLYTQKENISVLENGTDKSCQTHA